MNQAGDWRTLAIRIVEELLKRKCEAKIVVLPRYREQYAAFRKLRDKVTLPKAQVYGASLLASTSVFIGGGGTMAAEAAMMGIPSISYFPAGPTRVESFLEQRGLLIRIQDPESIAEQAMSWLEDDAYRAECRMRAERLLREMEDPLEVIVGNINREA
jgi:predicted glycosyltransferase